MARPLPGQPVGKPTGQPPDDAPVGKPYASLERWIWVLIYLGMFLVALGIATARIEEDTGWWLGVPGIVAIVAGIALIYVRSKKPSTR